jgi:type I restriction enzyme S subunit
MNIEPWVTAEDVARHLGVAKDKNLLFDAFTTKHLVSKPPQKLARLFFEIVALMESKKKKLLQETTDLAALRDWLPPLLMNGQVTVA